MFLFSIAMILVLGAATSRLFAIIKVPNMLGLILVGVIMGPFFGNLLSPDLLRISGDLRMLALVIILLRAGLGISREALNKVGKTALKMSAIPCLFEGGTVTLIGHLLLDLPWLEAGMLGFVIAAVSPAVVVPEMLRLQEKRLGHDKAIPVIILGGASIDDVFAITILTALLGIGTGSGQASVVSQLGRIPLEVLGGVMLGLALGLVLSAIFKSSRIPTTESDEIIIAIGAALAVVLIGQNLHVAGLLSVMATGFVLLERAPKVAHRLSDKLKKVWLPAEIFLFTLIGAQVDLTVALQAGLMGLAVIAIGLVGRSAGVFLATAGTDLNLKERLFCAVAYLPKATVQAAVGGLPLAAGVSSGSLILAVAVLSIVFTAPLGAWGMRLLAPRFLQAATGISPEPQLADD